MKLVSSALVTMLCCAASGGSVVPVPDERAPFSKQAADLGMRHVYEADSTGWYWVYRGVSHAQSFVAPGARISSLELRLARLNLQQPESPLTVEIRDGRLTKLYVSGQVRALEIDLRFRWCRVDLDHAAPLEPGKSYVLVVHAQGSTHEAPWIVNAVYRNVYPHGRHLGYDDDLFFRLSFQGGAALQVGPRRPDPSLPINSGCSTVPPCLKPLAAEGTRRPSGQPASIPSGR